MESRGERKACDQQLTLFSESCSLSIVIRTGDFIYLRSDDSTIARKLLYSLEARAASRTGVATTFRVFHIDGECLSGIRGATLSLRESLWNWLRDRAETQKCPTSAFTERIFISTVYSTERYLESLKSIYQMLDSSSSAIYQKTPVASVSFCFSQGLELSVFLKNLENAQSVDLGTYRTQRGSEQVSSPRCIETAQCSEKTILFSEGPCVTSSSENSISKDPKSSERILVLLDGFGALFTSSELECSKFEDSELLTDFTQILRNLISSGLVSVVCCDLKVPFDDSTEENGELHQYCSYDGFIGRSLRNLITKWVELMTLPLPCDSVRVRLKEFEPPGMLAADREHVLTDLSYFDSM